MAKEGFEEALAKYIEALTEAAKAYFVRARLDSLEPYVIEVTRGPKYVKLIQVDMNTKADPRPGSKSVFAFVDPETGDIFKPAGYSRPAKGARGNIFKLDTAPVEGRQLYR